MAIYITKGSKGELVRKIQGALHLVQDGIFGSVTEEAVKAFQKANNLKVDGIVGDKTWNLLFRDELRKSKRKIKYIIVHCTGTPEGRHVTVDDIRRWHTEPKPKGNGWSDIGYHVVVYIDGSVHNGRNVDLIGAHCEGYNANSIGVVYVGGCDKKMKPKDTRTGEQKKSLEKLLKDLRRMYPNAKIVGHCDLDKKGKKCPCFDAKEEYKNI